MRQNEVLRHGQPGHANDEHGADIGEERQGQPPQHRSVARVGYENFRDYGQEREASDVHSRGSIDEQAKRCGHGSEIGSEVDRVGDDEQPDKGIEQPRRIMPTDISGEASTRHPAHLSADQLDRAHQRIGEQQRPAHAVAELRAGLGIGGDAAGVVVRSAGDQAGSQDVPPARPLRLSDRLTRRIDRHIHSSLRLGCNVTVQQRKKLAAVPRSAAKCWRTDFDSHRIAYTRGGSAAMSPISRSPQRAWPRASKQALTPGFRWISARNQFFAGGQT